MSRWQGRYRGIISGREQSVSAAIARCGLRIMSWGYGFANWWFHRLYDWQLRETEALPVPVISIGNLTAGGTGKTPLVAFLTQWFLAHGVRVGLLSRGYHGAGDQGNDERQVLALACPETPHVQNPDRVAGGRALIAEHDVQVILLDDGYQHRRLARDLDLVLIDAMCPWGFGALLPSGLLREPLSALKRADLVVVTRTELVEDSELQAIEARIARHTNAPCVRCCYPPRQLRNATGSTQSLDTLRGARVAAFCGIGNPDGFRGTLEQCGVELVSWTVFPDHHHYTDQDLAEIASASAEHQPDQVVTTVKDLVKIPRTSLGDKSLWAVEVGTRFPDGLERIEPFLQRIMAQIPDA